MEENEAFLDTAHVELREDHEQTFEFSNSPYQRADSSMGIHDLEEKKLRVQDLDR